MKKLIFIVKAVLLLLVLQSCNNEWGDSNIPECDWDDTDIVQFYQLELKHPGTISIYHSNLLPPDRIERSLDNILYTNGDAPNNGNTASIDVNLYADGSSCTGSNHRKYIRYNGVQYIGATTINEVPFPSNAAFVGEVKVIIKTDVYNNTLGGNAYYHIKWEETGNDPNGGIAGQIDGQKIPYININGTNSIFVGGQNGYMFKNGRKDYL